MPTTTTHTATPTPGPEQLHLLWCVAYSNYERLLAQAPTGEDFRARLDQAWERLDQLSELLLGTEPLR